MKEFHQIR